MCVVSINIPEEILLDLHEDKNGFAEYMKKMLALDLYKNKKYRWDIVPVLQK